MASGATWDPQLEERVGEAVGAELRAAGANLTGAVSASMCCATRPGDGRRKPVARPPHHVGELGAALPRGLQRHVMACVKHFAAAADVAVVVVGCTYTDEGEHIGETDPGLFELFPTTDDPGFG